MTTIQAPSTNLAWITSRVTIPVAVAPRPFMTALLRQPGSLSRSQRRTMPAWESVKAVKTPRT